MTVTILEAVGRAARNRRDDVLIVQSLLVMHGHALGKVDGVCGQRTVIAIKAFQAGFLRHPDGVIHAGGLTWHRLSGTAPPPGTTPPKPAPGKPKKSPAIADDPLLRLVPKPAASTVNVGLSPLSNKFMLANFGNPREDYSQEDQPVTNEKLKKRMVWESVGNFKVTGLKPAVASLRAIMTDIQAEQPDVYPHIKSGGMLVVRNVRGSKTAISNHSWGCAIDLKLKGIIDPRGDDLTQHGLTLIAPIFNRHGWYWGVSFPVEDAMHFEAGKALATTWIEK